MDSTNKDDQTRSNLGEGSGSGSVRRVRRRHVQGAFSSTPGYGIILLKCLFCEKNTFDEDKS